MMGVIIGLAMELFLIMVAFKCIGLGFHWMRTGFKSLRINGDRWLLNLGKKTEEQVAEPQKVVVLKTIEADASVDDGQR